MIKWNRIVTKWIAILIVFIFIALIVLTCKYADEIDEAMSTHSVLIVTVP